MAKELFYVVRALASVKTPEHAHLRGDLLGRDGWVSTSAEARVYRSYSAARDAAHNVRVLGGVDYMGLVYDVMVVASPNPHVPWCM